LYLEAFELVGEFDSAEFIRADVTDKTDIEIAAITKAIIEVMADRTYILTRHDCYHDEPGNDTPCVMETI